jgi:O-antigen ligase
MAAGLVLCAAALAARLLPDVFALGVDQRAGGRLRYPVGYASTLGLVAAYGTILSVAFAAGRGRSRAVKVLAAGCTPVFATTLLLTYSRGPVAAVGVGLLVLLVFGRSSATPGALLATVVPSAAVTFVAYRAARLATGDFTSPDAVSQGHRVALALAVCAVLAAVLRAATLDLDRRRGERTAEARPGRRRPGGASLAGGAVALAALAIGIGIGLPAFESAYGRFSAPGFNDPNVRGRLTDAQGGDRLQAWRVALADFRSAPVLGRGAGTFVLSWDRSRPYRGAFNETHSVYLQMLGELGLVGLGLLLLALATIFVGLARRARRRDGVTFAAGLAAAAAWAVAVGVDWHWQMPVATLWLFAVGGAALAGPATPTRRSWTAARWLGIVALAGAAVLPARVAVAEGHLARALSAFRARDFQTAASAAGAAHSALGVLPAPLMLLGYSAAVGGQPALAVRYEQQAVSRDPDDWTFHYALALVRAAEGADPRPEARAALRLNPRESLVDFMVATLHGNDPRQWRRQVGAVPVVLPSVFD